MTVAELSVRRPVTIVMVYILICVISCVFIPRLGIALYPKTTMPVLSIFANYCNDFEPYLIWSYGALYIDEIEAKTPVVEDEGLQN